MRRNCARTGSHHLADTVTGAEVCGAVAIDVECDQAVESLAAFEGDEALLDAGGKAAPDVEDLGHRRSPGRAPRICAARRHGHGRSGGGAGIERAFSSPWTVFGLRRNSYQLFERCAWVLTTMSGVLACGRIADVREHRLSLIGADIAQR
jgi:hypothetical protein